MAKVDLIERCTRQPDAKPRAPEGAKWIVGWAGKLMANGSSVRRQQALFTVGFVHRLTGKFSSIFAEKLAVPVDWSPHLYFVTPDSNFEIVLSNRNFQRAPRFCFLPLRSQAPNPWSL
jgi:hypothetical protein